MWVRPDELEVIRERMAEAGIHNMSAYIRKMALGGYVLHVDLEPVKELVSLQRRCANNLNQAAIHANSYRGLYPDELKRLQKDYADLWGRCPTCSRSSPRWCACDKRERPRAAPFCSCFWPVWPEVIPKNGHRKGISRQKQSIFNTCITIRMC